MQVQNSAKTFQRHIEADEKKHIRVAISFGTVVLGPSHMPGTVEASTG